MTVSSWLAVLTAMGVAATGIAPAAPSPLAPASGPPAETSAGGFMPPLPLEVVTAFRPPATRYGAGHRGADLAAAAGQVVMAAADGVVVYADRLADRGVVSIEHRGGLRTTYEPVRATVAAGESVRAGDAIGVVEEGHGPCAPGVCLHLGARMPDRVYLDPLSLFRVWRVRLKPWDGAQ
jgi:murein DD-endopeptidase MepM/ murein hydrolase activator NlpD